MLTLRPSQKKCKAVCQIKPNHTQNHTRNIILTAAVVIRLSVVMMISIPNLLRYIEVKKRSINSRRRCCKKLSIAKKVLLLNLINHSQWLMIENNNCKAAECHICGQAYTEKNIRVRDYYHITGNYRGSAHNDYNLKLRINANELKIPVIFHNLKG